MEKARLMEISRLEREVSRLEMEKARLEVEKARLEISTSDQGQFLATTARQDPPRPSAPEVVEEPGS